MFFIVELQEISMCSVHKSLIRHIFDLQVFSAFCRFSSIFVSAL